MTRLLPTRLARFAGTAGLALALAGALAAPSATLAAGGRVVRATGSCTATSTANLKAKAENGRIGVEFEVDQNRNNRLWSVRTWDDSVRVFSGSRRTAAPSGSFTLRLLIRNRAGADRIRARATNAVTGEVCTATLTY
jgi:hypothetical protein